MINVKHYDKINALCLKTNSNYKLNDLKCKSVI